MGRYRTLLLLVLLGLFMEAGAQNYILLRKGTHSARILEGTAIRMKIEGSDTFYSGKLDRVLDSVVVFNGDSIPVRSIRAIQIGRHSFGVWLVRELGHYLPWAGLLYFGLGTVNSLIFDYPPAFSWQRTGIAAAMVATGFILRGVYKLIEHKTYSYDKWKISTMTFENLQEKKP